MVKNISKMVIIFLAVGTLATGCSSQPQPAPAPATTAAPAATAATTTSGLADVIKNGLPGTGPAMRGVSDSLDNMYYAAKGGNWGLAAYMTDVMQDYMSPIQISRIKVYPQWAAFVKGNLGDDSALKKAIDAKDMAAFEKAYSGAITNCNICHTNNGFKFIKKVKAAAPEANLDYTLKSEPSDNQ